MRRLPLHRIIPLLLTLAVFVVLGIGCRGGQKVVENLPQVPLTYWTVWDEPDDFTEIIRAYTQAHPNVRITVKKISYTDYDKTLLEAWARDEGPDIFSIPNLSVGKYREFITPMPESLTLPTLSVSGGCSKDIRVVEEAKPTIAPEQLDQRFVPAVAEDVIFGNAVYGLPLAADTFALYYNKDLLNNAKIIAPPTTWEELVAMVDASTNTLTREENGEIVQSGAALGTAKNINRSVDLLATLMMQSGANMTDPAGTGITFQNESPSERGFNPGAQAVNFYTAFANPARVTYTWSESLGDAQEAFAAGKVAFFFGYAYQRDIIRRQNPQLRFGTAPLPQISQTGPQVNYANYWVETVSKKTQFSDQAWDFLLFASAEANVRSYLTKTKKPTALRQLLAEQKIDLDLGVFADQLLIAKNWYHGYDNLAMETAIQEMIDEVLKGKATEEALSLAAQKVQQTMIAP